MRTVTVPVAYSDFLSGVLTDHVTLQTNKVFDASLHASMSTSHPLSYSAAFVTCTITGTDSSD